MPPGRRSGHHARTPPSARWCAPSRRSLTAIAAACRDSHEVASPTVGRLEAVDEHSCVLHTGGNSLDEMAMYLGLKGIDFEVLEPPELVEHIRALSQRLARAAG